MYRKLALAAVASLMPSVSLAQIDCSDIDPPYGERKLAIGGAEVGYYSSHSLATIVPNHNVRRAVFLIHGLDGSGADYYYTLLRSACRARNAGLAPDVEQDTILLSPDFRSTDDSDRPAGYHYWNSNHWAQGSQSTTGSGVSSYTVLDTLAGRLTGSVRMTPFSPLQRRFPNLEMIVVAGHSAGGQFAHRYAGTNAVEGAVAGVQMRYVVSAPSSFLYLDDHRPYTDHPSGVGDPYRYVSTPFVSAYVRNPGFSDAPMCPTSYNDWKFGLEDLNIYSSAVGAPMIRLRLYVRRVTVVIGSADSNEGVFDETCPARLQGATRYQRALRYLEYLDIRFPSHDHSLVEVAGATHSQDSVFIGPFGVYPTGAATLFLD